MAAECVLGFLSNTTPCRVTLGLWPCFGIGSVRCGGARFVIAATGRTPVGSVSLRSLTAGFLSRVLFIHTLPTASTPLIRGKSRMREFRTYGSVRGVPGNRHPYRYSFRDLFRLVHL